MGKLTISMAMFNSYVSQNQRVIFMAFPMAFPIPKNFQGPAKSSASPERLGRKTPRIEMARNPYPLVMTNSLLLKMAIYRYL